MKKRILIIVIASFMCMGVVSAASLWGNYKGNQVIRLTVDHDPVKVTDVPAISYEGRTMIPIYLLKQAGISYDWDGKNQTVNIFTSDYGIAESPTSVNVDKLKAYVEAADYFRSLENLGGMLQGLSDHLSLVFTGYNLGRDIQPDYDRFNDIINIYNDYVDDVESKKNQLAKYNVDISISNDILNEYLSAIDSYKLAYAGMDRFLVSGNERDFNSYLNNSSDGSDLAFSGIEISDTEYFKMINNAMNY